MGQTIVEKIIASHSDADEVAPGETVWIDIDLRTARDFGGANVIKHLEEHYPDAPIADRDKSAFTFDTVIPANNIPYATNQQIIRDFAKKWDIKVYDIDEGIGSHVNIEKALTLPGEILVGTDSHLNIMGAVGAFGQGMGDTDIAFAMKSGKSWFEVPASMKLTLEGEPGPNTSPKDIVLYVLRELGSKGALGRAVEYAGYTDTLGLAGRITVASMATEMGAIIAFIPPSNEVLKHYSAIRGETIEGVYADEDAAYEREVTLDLDGLTPQVARPPNPDNVVDAAALRDVEVDTVFLGSCTNGSYDDLAHAAELVEGRHIAPGVTGKVVPSTRQVWGRLLDEGHLKTFFDAGFVVSNPGCGGCASGQIGMTGPGEVQVSTSNRNFRGKQGPGETYLASPETAVAAALLGHIAPVSDLLEVDQ